MADVNKAIELDPKDDVALVDRGYIYEALGQNENAIVDYKHGLDLNPDNTYARQSLRRLAVPGY